MKTSYLLLTLSAAVAANEVEHGAQFAPCKKNGDCNKGLFCKPTDDGKFSMCQPNEGCAKLYGQCAGKYYSGPSCCGNGYSCHRVNEWYSQCVPLSHGKDSEVSCTNVSVEGDATYCIEGAICGGAGDKCPKKGDVAVADCIKTLTSYVDGAKCVAPADAKCQTLKTGAKGCVFGSGSPSTDSPVVTTAAPAKGGQCAENHSQCNGQNWPFGVCCKDPNYECNKKNDYLSLCEPKKQAMEGQAGEVAVWQQCGGNNYNGDKNCANGSKCTKINDWYSQCQPIPAGKGEFATWAQCAGYSNGFSNPSNKKCRAADKCVKYSDAYSQCVPQNQAMDAEMEQACTNVSVEGDATYCVEGPVCGGAGDKCPKKGDVAVADCIKTLTSYIDGAKCVAPADATCQVIKTGAKGCVFKAAAKPAAGAPSNKGQCSTNYSQCNGQNWPFGVCCQDPNFVCNKKNDYLSLCEPKKPAMDGEAGEVAVWQQCGGNGYNGDKTCATGTACTKINDWYSQCQPTATPAGRFNTYEQCDGSANGFSNSAKKTCRDEDKCQKYSDAYSQCVPKAQTMDAEAGEVAVWGQCGGNGYNGDKTCTTGNSCVKINDWYSQCQPGAAKPKEIPTWSQCGGKNNNFNANGKKCQEGNQCFQYNEWFWQCIPNKQ